MKLNYSDKVKFLSGEYQDKIGTYVDENSSAFLIKLDTQSIIIIVSKYNTETIIEKI
jgi:hypothetical protein